MPVTINGIGTKYYGAADQRPDGSFVTTEWFVIVGVPIWPLRSTRLIRAPHADSYVIIASQKGYDLVEQLPLRWSQVVLTYVSAACLLTWWGTLLWYLMTHTTVKDWTDNGVVLTLESILCAAAPAFAAIGLRKLFRR
ncbi:MAG: hypothetical protein U1E65_19145 [Myxococcota bacterium]